MSGAAAALLAVVWLNGAPMARGQEPQQPRYVERVDVSRVVIDVRVLDDRRSPITDLTADDFRVKIDGKPARVESALAMKHLAGVLAGNYVLLVEKPNTEPGTHRIGVDLVRRKGNVLARTSYVG